MRSEVRSDSLCKAIALDRQSLERAGKMGKSREETSSPPTQTIGLPTRSRAPTDAPPRIADYRFVKIIGQGAFGTVWLAEELMAGLFRAIKVLHPHGAERIERELEGIHAYQAQAKDHPHLVRILKTGLCTLDDQGQSRDRHDQSRDRRDQSRQRQVVYYVMEIADHAGGLQPHHPTDYEPLTLATLLRQKGRLSAGRVVEHTSALLDAIDHLHKAGLHHRDVKPANALFIGGTLKLADLGLTASDSSADPVGTPAYMPPPSHKTADGTRGDDDANGIRGQRVPDDLYALGKVMYEMTTGQPAADFPDWPADLGPAGDPKHGLPPEPHLATLRELINALCHPNAEKRLTSIRELRHRLATFTPFGPSPKTSRRRATLLVFLVAVVGIAIGGGGMKLWYDRTDPTMQQLGRAPYDGTEIVRQVVCEGKTWSLSRHNAPHGIYRLPSS